MIEQIVFGFVLLVVIVSSVNAYREINFGPCITPKGERAFCTDLEQCPHIYNMLLQTSITNEDKMYLTRSQCGSNNGKVLVCCPNNQVRPEPLKSANIGLIPEPGTCGEVMSNRVHGGTVADLDDYPWLALILYDKEYERNHHCAGSLINDRYILTVAHCMSRIPGTWKPVAVRLGEWDTTTDTDCKTEKNGVKHCADEHVEISIQNFTVHPDYVASSKNQLHDIALIRLSRPVNYTDFIKPICLPMKESLKSVSFDGIALDIAGWGLTENGTTSDVKLKAVVHGISLNRCQDVYRQHNVRLGNSQICAGDQAGVGSCAGDSGGPLVAIDASNKTRAYSYIAGIISLGSRPCALKGFPGVYTKVTDYLDWILENILP